MISAARIALPFALALSLLATPTPAADPSPKLPGTVWHSRKVDGSALLFVVEQVGLHLGTDGTFVAAIRLLDGQTMRRDGTYSVDDEGYVTMTVPGLGKPQRVRYWGDGGDMLAQDPAYDITVRFVPGAMEEGHWFTRLLGG